ncbi:MAG: EpsG family protein [Paucimonas sp.]|nr:EpsG family protein [Paucimonas sp.]
MTGPGFSRSALAARYGTAPAVGGAGAHGGLLLLFALAAFLLSLYQVFGVSPDFEQYAVFLDTLRAGGLDAVRERRFEPGFTLFSYGLARMIDSNIALVSALAMVCVLAKGWALGRACPGQACFAALGCYYLVRYFPLHEITQIRVSLAIACLLLAQVAVWSSRPWLALLACATALGFHTSALLVMPFLFFQPVSRGKVIAIAILALVLTRLQMPAVLSMTGSVLAGVEMYQKQGFGDRPANPVSLALLLDWCMVLFALVRWNSLSVFARKSVLLPLLGMAFYYGAMPWPVVAHRMFEMFSVFWVFFLADLLQRPALRPAAVAFMLLSGGWYSYIYIFSDRMFK